MNKALLIPAIAIGLVGGVVALGGAGYYGYVVWQTSLMRNGSLYANKLPPTAPVKPTEASYCQGDKSPKWVGCTIK